MAMEINGLNNNQTNSTKAKSSQRSNASAPVPTASGDHSVASKPNSDTVQISAEAKLLNKVSQSLGSDSPVNREKVEALRAAVADGSYRPNAQSIAQKMLDTDGLF